MKKRYGWVILLAILTFVFIYKYHNEEEGYKNISNTAELNDYKEKEMEKKYFMKKYYSPDYENCFIEKIESLNGFRDKNNKIFLNKSTDKCFDVVDSVRKKSICWIDNERFIVNGEYLYNIKTKAIEQSFSENLHKEIYVVNYNVNSDKDKIALIMTESFDSSQINKKLNYSVYVYDLKKNTGKEVYKSIDKINANGFYNIFWCGEDVLFDTDENTIFKYDAKNDVVGDFVKEVFCQELEQDEYDDEIQISYDLISVSEDSKYLSVGIFNEVTSIIDISKNKEVFSSEDQGIPYVIDFCWINDNTFAYIANYAQADNMVYIKKIDGDKYKNVTTIDCSDLKKNNNYILNLRAERGELFFDVIEFANSTNFDKIQKVDTYVIAK